MVEHLEDAKAALAGAEKVISDALSTPASELIAQDSGFNIAQHYIQALWDCQRLLSFCTTYLDIYMRDAAKFDFIHESSAKR